LAFASSAPAPQSAAGTDVDANATAAKSVALKAG
jgi:hypothetical protein